MTVVNKTYVFLFVINICIVAIEFAHFAMKLYFERHYL